jgi:hypothetical protein
MIRNKDKDQLTSLIYDLIADNKALIKEVDRLTTKVTTINILKKLYKFITYPLCYLYLTTIYKNKINDMMNKNNLSKETLVDTFNAMTKFENKQYNSLAYKDLFTLTTGVNICGGCGVGMGRVHNDLQRNVLNQFKIRYADLIPKITLYSGKYGSSDFYMNTIPFNTFHANEVVLTKMKNEHKQFKMKGYQEQTALLEADMNTLSGYIDNRKTIPLTVINQVEESVVKLCEKPTVMVDEDAVIAPVAPEVVEDIIAEEIVAEKEDLEVLGGNVSITFDVEKAYKMKTEGKSNKQIAKYFEVTYQKVSKELKKYMEPSVD